MFRKILMCLVFMSASATAKADNLDAKWLTVEPQGGGFLSITFDDATTSQFEVAYPILRDAGLVATLFVNTGPLDKADPYFMDWNQVRTLSRAGWEIGAHSVTHQSLLVQNDVEVVGELVFSRDRIEAEVGTKPRSFASPFGDYDNRVLGHIARYYDIHLRAWGDHAGINPAPVDPLLVERVNVDGSLTVDEVCRMVREVGKNQWLVLMFHQVRAVQEPDERFVSTPEQLSEIVACIKVAVVQNSLASGTVSGVYEELTEE